MAEVNMEKLEELAGKVVYMSFVLPVAALLAIWLRPDWQVTAVYLLISLPAQLMAWLPAGIISLTSVVTSFPSRV